MCKIAVRCNWQWQSYCRVLLKRLYSQPWQHVCRIGAAVACGRNGGNLLSCTDMPGGMAAACSGIEESWSLCVLHNALCGQR